MPLRLKKILYIKENCIWVFLKLFLYFLVCFLNLFLIVFPFCFFICSGIKSVKLSPVSSYSTDIWISSFIHVEIVRFVKVCPLWFFTDKLYYFKDKLNTWYCLYKCLSLKYMKNISNYPLFEELTIHQCVCFAKAIEPDNTKPTVYIC